MCYDSHHCHEHDECPCVQSILFHEVVGAFAHYTSLSPQKRIIYCYNCIGAMLYSVAYSPPVFLIIRSASSIKFSHCHTELLEIASLWYSRLFSYKGASVRLPIMFDQCVMSSSQVPLFCEWPASACEQAVAQNNMVASNSAFIVWLFIWLSHYFTQVSLKPSAIVPIHQCYYDTYGQAGDVEQHHKGPIDQEPHMLAFYFLLCKFFDSEVQVTDWLLTRPIRGYESHDDPGQYEYA